MTTTTSFHRAVRTVLPVSIAASCLLLATGTIAAQTVAPPFAGTYSVHDLGSITGLPTSYGGLTFKAGDPNTIVIGGKANQTDGLFYEVPVTRDGSGHIASFGTPVALGFGANNDGGVAYGPGGVLFYSKYALTRVGQVAPGATGDSKVSDLAPLGVVSSPGALNFVPPGFGGEGGLKVCSYSGGQFYSLTYAADGSGTYDITAASQTATLGGGPEGFIYAPAGSPLFPNATLLVTEYSAGKVAAYDVNGSGDPITSTRRDFITGLSGGEGATIDPITGDFLFSTFGSSNRVIQVRGFNPPPPAATVTLASSSNPSTVGSSVTFTATVTSNNSTSVTGTVTFKSDGIDIAGCVDVAVSGGTATCATSALAVGTHPIGAFYGGNSTNGAGDGSLSQQVLDPPPGGVGSGLRLWLDAADTRTLYGDAACTSPVTVSGNDVACWLDKSADGSDVIDVGTANGEPTWLTNQFNGQPALEFKKTEADTLRHVLGTAWISDYTEFVVFQQQGTPQQYDSFFSNGPQPNALYHQITYLNPNFSWAAGSTVVGIEPWSNELKLYAVRGTSTGTEVFADGASQGTSGETGGRNFVQYRINQNRSGDRLTNSKIAEVIVYDRALTDCEIEDVNFYLGAKYGRDFLDIASGWDWTAPYVNDVNGIASFSGACPAPKVVDSAQSSVATIDDPAGLDAGEKLLIGHDGATLGSTQSTSGTFDARVTRVWRVDANEPANPGIAVRVNFDLSQTTGIDPDPSRLELLVWPTGADPATDPPTVIGNPSVAGDVVSFDNVTFAHGDHFTLGHAAPDGILVQNASAVDYPALGPAVVPAPNIRVAFPFSPSTSVDQAKVDISENYEQGADVLSVGGSTATSGTVNGLAWSWDATTGVLTLTGTATPAVYEDALRQVTFRNTSGSPSTAQRKLTYSLGSGLRYPGTGHFYEFVPAPSILQSAAIPAAAGRTYFGLQGYLTTVTSQGETDFIIDKLGGKGGWIGASDAAVEGSWRWVTGPEGLEDGGQGRLFFQGGAPVGGAFVNWNPGEPNGSGDVAYFIKVNSTWGGTAGKWDDIPDTTSAAGSNIDGYVVEYGGLAGDPVVSLADTALVNVLVPTLQLTKTPAAASVDVTQPISYTLAVTNTGAAPALGVVLHDTVPPGASFVSASDGGTLSGSTVTWSLPDLAPGASDSVTVTVNAPSVTGGMANTADASARNAATVQATATVNVLGPRLTLQKTGATGVTVGGPVTYTLVAGNSGTGTAFSPVLVDTIPTGAAYVSSSPAGSVVGSTVTWNLADLAPSGSTNVSLTVTAPATAGTMTNSASLSATAATSVTATATTRVTTCTNTSTACLTKGFLPGTILADTETSTLTLVLENGTDGANRTVSFTDNLPAGLVLANTPTTPQCGGAITGNASFTSLQVNGATLGPGQQSCTITVNVRGTSAGAKVNDASRVVPDPGSPVDVSAANATVVVTKPVLGLTKTAAPTSAVVDSTVTYTLAYENTGTATATGVQLVDPIPTGATFVSATGGGVFGGGSVTWNLPDIQPGSAGAGSVSVTVRVPSSPTTLTNTATLSAAAPADPAQDSATVDVFGEPSFEVSIVDVPDPVDAGANLHYVVTIRNTGTIASSGTTLELQLPPDATFQAATPTASVAAGVASWSLGAIPVNGFAEVAVTVRVNAPLPDGTVLIASATADADNLPAPVSVSEQTTVVSKPELFVDLVATPTVVQGGGGVTYVVSFENRGTDVAAGTSLSLTVPSSTTVQTVGGAATVSGQVVTWPIGALQPGQTGSYTVTAGVDTGVPDGTPLTAVASLTSMTTCGSPPAPCSATDDETVTVTAKAVLELTKSGPSQVAAGAAVTYVLTFANSGNVAAQDVVLTDVLPANTAFVSATGGGVCSDGQTPPGSCVGPTDGSHRVVWDVGTLGIGEAATVYLTVAVTSPLGDGTLVVNTASIESTATDGPAGVVSDPVATTVSSLPAFILDKQGPAQVSAGSPVLYTLSYTNVGTDVATGVVVTDQLPPDTTFVSASGGGAYDPAQHRVTWSLGAVPAGVGSSMSLVLGVNSPLPNGTVLVNNVTITSAETPPLTRGVVTRVLSAPLLLVAKSSSPQDQVAAGGTVNYTISYRNDGNEDLLNAVLTDQLPPGYTPQAIGGGGVWDAATGRITWNLGTVRAGTSATQLFSMPVPVDTPNGTVLTNTATLVGDDAPGMSAVDTVRVTSSPILELTKTGPAYAASGGSVTYELHYANTGNATAYNVVLEDQLDPNTAYVTASGAHSEAAGLISWTLGDLPPGSGGSLVVIAGVFEPLANGTVLTNTAGVDGGNAAPVSDSVTTVVTSEPVLELDKAGPARVAAGNQMTYTLSYRNRGTDRATGVVLVDQLPPLTSFVSASGGGVEVAPGRVEWNLGVVEAGAGASVTLTVATAGAIFDGTRLINEATLTSLETQPVSATSTTTVVSAPILSLTKTADPASTVAPNSTISYTIEISNVGNEDALNCELLDLVPAGTSVVGSTVPASLGAGFVSWDVGTLAVGETRSYSLIVAVPAGTPDGTRIVNSVGLYGDDAPPVYDEVEVVVNAGPALRHSKVASVSTMALGDLVTYTLEYQNIGNGLATNAILMDAVPPFMNFVSATAGGVWDPVARTVTWSFGDLAPGSGGSVLLTLGLDPGQTAPDGTVLTNTSSFVADGLQMLSAAADVTVRAPVLTLTKSGAPEPVSAGDQLLYLLSYANVGGATATGVVIQDALGSLVTFAGLTGPGSYDSATGVVTWLLPDLPPGASGSVTLLVEVVSPLLDGTEVRNYAFIDCNESGEQRASASNTVLSAPGFTMTKTGTPDPVGPNGTVTYTIVLENVGNEDATSTVVIDTLPAGTTFVSADGGGVYDPGTHEITWAVKTLPAGGTLVLTVQVRVGDRLGPVTNTVVAYAAENPPLTVTNTVSVAEVTAIPTLSTWGLIALIVMLALGGLVILRRTGGGA